MLFEKEQKRELIRQNQQLKRQLEKAKNIISSLYKQIEELKISLAKYEKTPPSPSPATSEMTMQQEFLDSSDEENNIFGGQQITQQEQPSPVKPRKDNLNHSNSIGKMGQMSQLKLSTKVIYNPSEQTKITPIQKLIKKSSERKKQIDNSFNEPAPINLKAMSTRQIPLPGPFMGKQFSLRSQKSLFKKTTQSRPIFEHFFVTGVDKVGPCIIYSYPKDSDHDFSGYLALIYSDNHLKVPDLSPCNSRTKLTPSQYFKDGGSSVIKRDRECFVIPIMKQKLQSAERDYLVICESQQTVLQKNDKDLSNCIFNRYYCFLTQWKFFSQIKKLANSLIDRLQIVKKHCDFKSEVAFGVEIGEQLQQSLNFLHQKSTDYNKTIDCCIGESGLRFSADIPPLESSFQMVQRFTQNKLYNTPVYVKKQDQQILQTKLCGLLLAYGLAEVKIVLYSNNKQKVSQSILQFLELIRPLTYVNPIIVSALRQQHQTYLDAPMGLILGLWSQSRKSNRQKIQIFMNKKLNLAGLIEKAKLTINQGIVINLDTGLVFGGSINNKLNAIAVKLSNLTLWTKLTRNMRDYYKFVERMLAGRCDNEQAKAVWSEVMVYLKKTQMYCYYTQNREI